MKLRTELEIRRSTNPLNEQDSLVSLGSCFSHAVGSRLFQGGISISVTPMGILFNPLSIGETVKRALERRPFSYNDLYQDSTGIFHALAFESRRQNTDADLLLGDLNKDFDAFSDALSAADCWLITFGTAWCFSHIPTNSVVGNCHKLNDKEFNRFLCSVEQITNLWTSLIPKNKRIIFSVSPVRHLNDGLHGNTLSKSILHLSINHLVNRFPNVEYFPAYEALNDDLRDYRFYADDLKHPSTMAEEYIFELFLKTYYETSVIQNIVDTRRKFIHQQHRPILT